MLQNVFQQSDDFKNIVEFQAYSNIFYQTGATLGIFKHWNTLSAIFPLLDSVYLETLTQKPLILCICGPKETHFQYILQSSILLGSVACKFPQVGIFKTSLYWWESGIS